MKDARIKRHVAEPARVLLERWIVRGRMTQGEAAERIGISRIKLNQYLNAVARPSLETAIRIEDASGIAVRAWLVDDPLTVGVGEGDIRGMDELKAEGDR